MIAHTWRSAFEEVFIGGTWYQAVYSHSQAWPGIVARLVHHPPLVTRECWASPRLARYVPSARNRSGLV